MKLLPLLIVICAISALCTAQTSPSEKEVLLDLYQKTNGDSWNIRNSWGSPLPYCQWYGVTCSGGSVIKLDLSTNNLQGELPSSLGNLENLQSIQFGGNTITGEIPESFGELEELTQLDLKQNSLSGPIPGGLFNASEISELDVSDNQLTELEIPSHSTASLRTLDVGDNQISSLPDALGEMDLISIKAKNNEISQVGDSIFSISSLQNIDLSNNNINMNLPDMSGLVYVNSVQLQSNMFTGTLQGKSIKMLEQLRDIDLSNNLIEGPFPENITSLSSLNSFEFSSNNICCPLPDAVRADSRFEGTCNEEIPCTPPQPENIRADTVGRTTLTVAWDFSENYTSVEAFYVRYEYGSESGVSSSIPSNKRQHTINNLPESTEVSVSVEIETSFGTRSTSSSASFTTHALPSEPQDLEIAEIIRDPDLRANITWESPSSSGGVVITRYVITLSSRQSDDDPWENVDTDNTDDLHYLTPNLDEQDDSNYRVQVEAENQYGKGPAATEVFAAGAPSVYLSALSILFAIIATLSSIVE